MDVTKSPWRQEKLPGRPMWRGSHSMSSGWRATRWSTCCRHAFCAVRIAPGCARPAGPTSTLRPANVRPRPPTADGPPSKRSLTAWPPKGRVARPARNRYPSAVRTSDEGSEPPWQFRSERPPASVATPAGRRIPSKPRASDAARAARARSVLTTFVSCAGITAADRSSTSRSSRCRLRAGR